MSDGIALLAQDWLIAKRKETQANVERIAIEDKMVALIEVPAEGSKTQKIGDYKITVTQPVSRKLDETEWALVASRIPTNLHPVKTKLEADAVGIKWLAQNEPLTWAKIATAFETKPGKVGIKVEAM